MVFFGSYLAFVGFWESIWRLRNFWVLVLSVLCFVLNFCNFIQTLRNAMKASKKYHVQNGERKATLLNPDSIR